jgi:hypothetical protein
MAVSEAPSDAGPVILDRMEFAAVACERPRAGFLEQPANALTSAAFVVAAAGILLTRRRLATDYSPRRSRRPVFAVLVAGIGVGSFIQHGPHPGWQTYAHDLPLASILVFVATDAVSDLTGHERSDGWWLLPSVGMVPVVAIGPTASTLVQAVMASIATGLNLLRAVRRPALRRTVLAALATAAAGAVIAAGTDRSALCRAGSLFEGHAVWHVLAAGALWLFAPAVGARCSGYAHPGGRGAV